MNARKVLGYFYPGKMSAQRVITNPRAVVASVSLSGRFWRPGGSSGAA